MEKTIRRVVTVQNKDNCSVIESDYEINNIDHFIKGIEEARSYNVWTTHEMPKSPKKWIKLPKGIEISKIDKLILNSTRVLSG